MLFPRWSSRLPLVHVALLAAFVTLTFNRLVAQDALDQGRNIFEAKCAACHGASGQGVDGKYDEALVGDLPVAKLAKLIADTMPEGKPGECVGEDAKKVADYIDHAFYSPAARARKSPARIELSRLTTRQYDNAIADLVGLFTGPGSHADERGLKAAYFDSRDFKADKRRIERIDPNLDFDFGTGSPDEKLGVREFSINWQGSLIADETGVYEIIVNTPNGMRLWLNNPDEALIDAWVASAGDHRATIRLLGGRRYMIRIEYFKFKDPQASISLQWRPPHGVREVIPMSNLSPHYPAPVMVVQTPFPPDDSSFGYQRGTSVSKSWEQATTRAAIEIADWVTTNIDQLSNSKPDSSDRSGKLKKFCQRFTERAFRRPLTNTQRQLYVDQQFEKAPDDLSAVKRVLLLVLKSPRFLYLGLNPRDDEFEIASRLSFGIWDSIPDDDLWYAAGGGRLKTESAIEQHSNRMINDPRAKSKLKYFFHDWLRMNKSEPASKDQQLFPGFDDQLVGDLRRSLDISIERTIWNGGSDFRELLTSEQLYLNKRLAEFYGAEIPDDHQFHPVSLKNEARAGLLTHPYLLSELAYHRTSSPIHRGVFIARNLIGRTLKSPPVAIKPAEESDNREFTTRQRVDLQTRDVACQGCHSIINPLGFSLENFDAVGRFRELEKGKPIDAQSAYVTPSGKEVQLKGARELAAYLADDPGTHRSFILRLFNHLLKQPVAAYGPDVLKNLERSFAESNFNVRKLIVEIANVGAGVNTSGN